MIYEFAPDIQEKAEEISEFLFPHIQINNIKCFRSFGTSSRLTIARCHALGKILQKAIDRQAFYALEFLSERFDRLDDEEQLKVIMHELMHIPKTFGGGFKHHDFVCDKNINKYCREYKLKRKKNEGKIKENQIEL